MKWRVGETEIDGDGGLKKWRVNTCRFGGASGVT